MYTYTARRLYRTVFPSIRLIQLLQVKLFAAIATGISGIYADVDECGIMMCKAWWLRVNLFVLTK